MSVRNSKGVQDLGLGSYLPPDVSRQIVPRLPRRWQRFTPAATWAVAENESVGYADLPVAQEPARTVCSDVLGGNDMAMVGAFGVALGALSQLGPRVRVVDFGGFDGQHADLVQSLFPKLSFEWIVVDLPSVVEVMSGRSRPGLQFRSDLSVALEAKADVVLASASLNYVPDPFSTLGTMCANSTCVVLTRLPLWPIEGHAAAIQHAQRRPVEISYPTWFFSEDRFRDELPTGSRVLLDFVCPDDRAGFAGHYSAYRGLVIATDVALTQDQS